MIKSTMKYNDVTNKTTIRVLKSYIRPHELKILLESEVFNFLESNNLNHVFSFNGTIGKAEFELKKLIMGGND